MTDKIKKYFDWATRLDKYFEDCATRSFEYGVFDCALFMADGVKAMTGVDVAAERQTLRPLDAYP